MARLFLRNNVSMRLSTSDETGVSMVEFVLVIGLLLFLVFGFFDLSRYLLVQNLLSRAAEQTVNNAKKDIRFGFDFRHISTPDASTVTSFESARDEMITNALTFPQAVLDIVAGDEHRGALVTYRMPDPAAGFQPGIGGAAPVEAKAAIIFPGQSVEIVKQDGSTEMISHPTCPDAITCPAVAEAGPSGWEQVMLDHPIVTEVRAEIPLLFLAGRRVEVIGRAVAWQERVPVGLGAEMEIVTTTLATTTQTLPPATTTTTSPPAPRLCSIVSANEACDGQCILPHQRCEYLPNGFEPNCFRCVDRKCSDWTNQTNWCATTPCPDTHTCTFKPNGVGLDCHTCTPKPCSQWQNQSQYCQAQNCEGTLGETYECQYIPYWHAPNCGTCQKKTCSSWKSQQQYCAELNCEATLGDTYFCQYVPYWKAPSCGSCEKKSCSDWKSQQQYCAELNCEGTLGDTYFCQYVPYWKAPSCGSCEKKSCSDWKSQQQYCAELNCEGTLGDTYFCQYVPYWKAPSCGSCEKKSCSEWKSKEQYCRELDCEGRFGDAYTCQYIPYWKAPNCGDCIKKTCSDWMSPDEYCQQMDCEATHGPDWTCQFIPYWQAPTCGQCVKKNCGQKFSKEEYCASINCIEAPGSPTKCNFNSNASIGYCGSCSTKRCFEFISQAEHCANQGCQPWQSCNFNPNAFAPNCGSGCTDQMCKNWTNATQACQGKCAADEKCVFKPNNVGQTCHECVKKTCAEMGLGLKNTLCAAINCSGSNQTCNWDPNSTDHSSCSVSCEAQPCSNLNPTQVCAGNPCGQIWLQCQFNPNGLQGIDNCYTCTPLQCIQWTTEQTACAGCLSAGQNCNWDPASTNPAQCGQCVPRDVGGGCVPQVCDPGEIWNPSQCICEGSA